MATRHTFAVTIDGQALDPSIHSRIFRIEIDTTFGMASTFSLHFYDNKGTLVDDTKFDPGKAVVIKARAANENAETTVMEGEITSVEPFYSLTESGTQFIVRGYDKTHRLTKGTKSRVFINSSHSDIVSTILNDYGLTSTDIESTTPTYDHIFQDNQNDREFIEGLARINGYTFGFSGGKTLFKKPAGDTEVALTWKSSMTEFQPRVNAVGIVDTVKVTGWDPATKEVIVGEATSVTNKPTDVTDSPKGLTAARRFGDSTYQAYIPNLKDATSATNIAKALLDTFNAAYVEAEGMCEGNTKLIAGTKAQISGLGTRFDGTYFVTSARHIIEQGEYHVYFSSEGSKTIMMSDMILGAAGAKRENNGNLSAVVPAIVTNIKDDEKDIVRVKVKYPWIDDQLESHWARMTSVGVGATNTGIHWLPQVNDEVLVAFENGNINRPYVLGGLWNGSDKAPQDVNTTINDGIRTIQTPAGNIIRLTDKSGGEKIEIIDAKGVTTVTMDGGGNKLDIVCTGDLTIKADGTVTIEGAGVTVKSTSTLDLEGSGASKLETGAALTIKGATVAIN